MIKVCKVGLKSCIRLLLFRNKAIISVPARYRYYQCSVSSMSMET